MSEDWKRQHANDAEAATKHPLVLGVMAELRDNLGVSEDSLPAYGILKVACYAAQVARAQALGFDPDLLRVSAEEAGEEQMRRVAELVLRGVPVHVVDARKPVEVDLVAALRAAVEAAKARRIAAEDHRHE